MGTTNPNRDTARAVYTPVKASRSVDASSPEDAPTLSTDGTDSTGFSVLLITRKHNTATTSNYVLWLFDGDDWLDVEDTSTLDVADYDPTADNQHAKYDISGWSRYYVQFTTGNGSVVVNEIMQV